ncbi:MAG: hypothetical protein KF891_11735 [Rhizobacter sp.]|nr:hypothetical protein [Rhizobacter sp.]
MSDDLDKLAFAFFKLFAKYEYALKAMGYGLAGPKQSAEADWDRFSTTVGVKVLSVTDAEVKAAIQYIFQKPPKRQVWVNDAVNWEVVPNGERSAQILFSHIRRARNNLYHGGKFGSQWIDPDRSQELLETSILILNALVLLDAALAEAIYGAA